MFLDPHSAAAFTATRGEDLRRDADRERVVRAARRRVRQEAAAASGSAQKPGRVGRPVTA